MALPTLDAQDVARHGQGMHALGDELWRALPVLILNVERGGPSSRSGDITRNQSHRHRDRAAA